MQKVESLTIIRDESLIQNHFNLSSDLGVRCISNQASFFSAPRVVFVIFLESLMGIGCPWFVYTAPGVVPVVLRNFI